MVRSNSKELNNLSSSPDLCLIYEQSENLKDILIMTNLSLKNRLIILLDIALGIKAMHSCMIAHTNIKLENVVKCDETYKIANLDYSIDISNIPTN